MPFGGSTLPPTNVPQVFLDSGWYCAVLPGTEGMRIKLLQCGHRIWRPDMRSWHCQVLVTVWAGQFELAHSSIGGCLR